MKVFILVTNRQPEVSPGSVMVFDSLRIGFPTATIRVMHNGLSGEVSRLVGEKHTGLDAECISETIHHDWISQLIELEDSPFFICDTDMVFWSDFERWDFSGCVMAGRRIPQWRDEFTKCVTRPRLHTSLLYINPVKVREFVRHYRQKFPITPFNPFTNLIDPLCVPLKGETYFYDTMSMMYHAIGGTPFNDRQLDCYDHMNFGTIEDVVLPHLSNGDRLREARKAVYSNPASLRGVWREQEKYYTERAA